MTSQAVEEGMEQFNIGGTHFGYSGVRVDTVEESATEFTLATIVVDVTGSTVDFADDLRKMLVAAVDACKKNPLRETLMVRVLLFSTIFGRTGVQEVHGFKFVKDIDPEADYPQFSPGGRTPLYDAAFSAVGGIVDYGAQLMKDDFMTNGIVFLITDGGETGESIATLRMIAEQNSRVIQEEALESLVSILISINAVEYGPELDLFFREAGFNHRIDMNDVTASELAKLGGFISQSVSSQALDRGSGGPSQNISATI